MALEELKIPKDIDGLDSRISTLEGDRGYLNSKNVTTSTDDCTVNGKYYGSSSVLNLPESYSWVMDVIKYNDNFMYQTIHMGSGRIFFRLKISSGWQPWQQIATKKIYSSFDEVRKSFNQNTPLVTIENAMENSSILITTTYLPDSTNSYPSASGNLIIIKAMNNRTKLEYIAYTGEYYFGYIDEGVFKGWQQIATTTKTPFSCTASTNITIITQSCYVLNGEFTMTMRIKKTDNSTFTQGASYAIATTPITPSVTHIASAMAKSTSNETWSVSANVFAQNSNKTIYAIATTANAKEIYFTVKGGIA